METWELGNRENSLLSFLSVMGQMIFFTIFFTIFFMILLLLEIIVFLFFSHILFFHTPRRETIQKIDNSNVYDCMRPK